MTDDLLPQLAELACDEPSSGDVERATVLVADAIANCLGGPRLEATGFANDGTAGTAGLLALQVSSRDLDDVDWTSLHHPGSVVNPVVLALAAEVGGGHVARAVIAGYRAAATFADLLGAEHRGRWHVTATAGAIGAASAASVMLGLSTGQQSAALALAAANVGGIGQAPLERMGAAAFNRAAAAVLGLTSARAASAGAVAARSALSGQRGVLTLMAAGGQGPGGVREGIRDASLRLFPVTGFAHAAVRATAELSASSTGTLDYIEVSVPAGTAVMTDGSAGGDWWNLRVAVARAWDARDPYLVDSATPGGTDPALVRVVPSTMGNGRARVVATTSGGDLDSGEVAPFSLDAGDLEPVFLKWSTVLGQDPGPVLASAREFMESGSIDLERLVR